MDDFVEIRCVDPNPEGVGSPDKPVTVEDEDERVLAPDKKLELSGVKDSIVEALRKLSSDTIALERHTVD